MNYIVFLLITIGVILAMGEFSDNTASKKQRNIICKQAYAAKVYQKIQACNAWKTEIDNEIKDKLEGDKK